MYHLLAPLHQGQVLSLEEYRDRGYEGADHQLISIYKISETIEPGYADVGSITNWYEIGMQLDRDFIFNRNRIKDKVTQLGLNQAIATINDSAEVTPTEGNIYLIGETAGGNLEQHRGMLARYVNEDYIYESPEIVGYRTLTEAEQYIALQCKVGSTVEFYQQFGIDEVKRQNLIYHEKSIKSRTTRLHKAEIEIYHELPTHYMEVAQDLITPIGDLTLLYQYKGITGTEVDYHPYFNPSPIFGIVDYMIGTGYFASNGLPSKDWLPASGITLQQLSDRMYQIFVIG